MPFVTLRLAFQNRNRNRNRYRYAPYYYGGYNQQQYYYQQPYYYVSNQLMAGTVNSLFSQDRLPFVRISPYGHG